MNLIALSLSVALLSAVPQADCHTSRLMALSSAKNASIATQSAWKRVRLTLPKENGLEIGRSHREKLSWFIGFFEGRNRITVPKWWRTIVMDGGFIREPQKIRPYHQTAIEGVNCPLGATVEEKDRIVTYRSGTDSIVLPEELLDRDDSGELWCNISCVFTARHCFVAVHDDVGYDHDVACIDRGTNKIVWKSKACGCWWGRASGLHESWVSLVATDDGRVFVFGAAWTGFYAHGFDASNGKTLVRFSSND